MTTATAERKKNLEAIIAKICKDDTASITVRSLREFTISFDGKKPTSMANAKEFLSVGGNTKWSEIEYDEECDMTFAYFEVTL